MIGTLNMRVMRATKSMGLLWRHLMLLLRVACIWLNRWRSLIRKCRTQSIERGNNLAVPLRDLHLKLRNHHLPLMLWVMARL
jgi:hypothetical protein